MVLHSVMNQTNNRCCQALVNVDTSVAGSIHGLKGHISLHKVEEWKGK